MGVCQRGDQRNRSVAILQGESRLFWIDTTMRWKGTRSAGTKEAPQFRQHARTGHDTRQKVAERQLAPQRVIHNIQCHTRVPSKCKLPLAAIALAIRKRAK